MPEERKPIRRAKMVINDDEAKKIKAKFEENMPDFDAVFNAKPVRMNEEQVRERVRVRNEELLRALKNGKNPDGGVIETVGLELESVGKSQDFLKKYLTNLPQELYGLFKVHHDASTEMNVFNVAIGDGRKIINLDISAQTDAARMLFRGNYNTTVSGYELVSVPMNIDVAELALYAILPRLQSIGDFATERCATHVHVGMAKNLTMTKNLLSLGLWFDEIFYALAGMGEGKFRGHSNNAIYARPLISGPFFRKDGNYYRVLNWEQALQAKSFYEFFACYAYNVENGDVPKYHPARYFSINLYSLLLHKTVEFRHFNQSFNPAVVSAITRLCQVFVELAVKSNSRTLRELEPGDVFKREPTSHYLNKLDRFLNMASTAGCEYSLNKFDIVTLNNIISSYQGIGIKNNNVLTHVKDVAVSGDIIAMGRLEVAKDKPIPDGHIDIHNIKDISIMKG